MKKNPDPPMISTEDLARMFSCSKSTILDRARKRPGFPQPIREGKALRWPLREIEAYIEREEQR